MKMDRLMLCREICKQVHIARVDPNKKFLTKRELLAVHSYITILKKNGDRQVT